MADFSNLSGVSSAAYTDYTAQTQLSRDVQKQIGKAANKDATDEELMNACKQFESYFMEQVYKSMQKTVEAFKRDTNDSDVSDALSMTSSNSLVDYFKDLTLQDIVSTQTDIQSNGLAQMLYENMRRNYGISADALAAAEVEAASTASQTEQQAGSPEEAEEISKVTEVDTSNKEE